MRTKRKRLSVAPKRAIEGPAPLLPRLGCPGVVTLLYNRREAAALLKAQKDAPDGPDGVAVVQFSLEELAERVMYLCGPADRPLNLDDALHLKAWALCFDAAGFRIRQWLDGRGA